MAEEASTKKPVVTENLPTDVAEEERLDEAIACYDEALKCEPDNKFALRMKAYSLFELKRFKEALACTDAVLAIDPNNVHALRTKAGCCVRLYAENPENTDKLVQAARCYTAENKLNVLRVRHVQGWILDKLGQHEEAAKYEDDFFAEPNPHVLYDQGFVLDKLRGYEETNRKPILFVPARNSSHPINNLINQL